MKIVTRLCRIGAAKAPYREISMRSYSMNTAVIPSSGSDSELANLGHYVLQILCAEPRFHQAAAMLVESAVKRNWKSNRLEIKQRV